MNVLTKICKSKAVGYALLAVFCAAGAGIYIRSAAAAIDPEAGPIRVMALGDSITEGMHNTIPSQDGGYRHVLNDYFDANYPGRVDFVGSLTIDSAGMTDPQHEGHAGYRIDQISSGVNSWLSTYNPHVVLLHIDTNDVIQNYSGTTMTASLDQLLGRIYATAPNTTVILASLIPQWGPPGTWTHPPVRVITVPSQALSASIRDKAAA
ncbi:MAG TPA: GDSL-type esterase/lipase family protein [Candidatus Saccharimonadales bacterium]